MSEQERKVKRGKEPPKEDDAPQTKASVTEKGKKLKEEMDNLMDEIDEILEENAEEFVKSYVQRGGE